MICPFATWKPIGSHGGAMSANLGLVLHVTTNHASPYGFFSNPAHQASSHFWVGDDGELEQYIDTASASWAQAAGNYLYVSVETSGTPDQPLTPAQVATLARLYAWGHIAHGWPFVLAETPGLVGFAWHGMGGAAWGGHPDCPGDLRRSQRIDVIRLARGPVVGPPPAPTPAPINYPEDNMQRVVVNVAFAGGHAWVAVPGGDGSKVVSVVVADVDPVKAHGYPALPAFVGVSTDTTAPGSPVQKLVFGGAAPDGNYGAVVWLAT